MDAALAQAFTTYEDRMDVPDVEPSELYHGAERNGGPASRIAIIEGFAARLNILPFDTHAASTPATSARHSSARAGRSAPMT